MTIESALWMQNVDYPARLDRALIALSHDEGVLDLTALLVSERGAGANFTVDIAVGKAIVEGDDEPNQGNYYAASTSVENVVVSAAPGSNSRIDRVVLQVNDANAGGAGTNDVTIEVIAGVVSASPVAPALPDSAISLALIGPITNGTAAITDSLITDARQVAGRRCTPATLEWRADSVVPSGWLASGPDYDPADYPELFAHIGTTYGGNGSSTFGTPDGAGRALVGPGGSIGDAAGDNGGSTTHTLTTAQIPSHSHSIATHSHSTPSHTHSMASHTHSITHNHASADTGDQSHTHDHYPATPSGEFFLSRLASSATSQFHVQEFTSGSGMHVGWNQQTGESNASHHHALNLPSYSGTSGSGGASSTGSSSGTSGTSGATSTGNAGSGNAHSILQPYQVVGGLVIRT